MKIVNENDLPEKQVPGRTIRWLYEKGGPVEAEFLSFCVINITPGSTVTPAHSHPDGEELVYIMSGNGHVYIDGEIRPMEAGCAILFEKGSKHMLRNSGDVPMKVACFYAPATNMSEYSFHPEVDFDNGRMDE